MKNYILFPLASAWSFCEAAQVTLSQLRTENSLQPAALDERQPRFSWQLQSGKRGVMQTAYELEVSDDKGKLIWQPGKIASPQSVLKVMGGKDGYVELLVGSGNYSFRTPMTVSPATSMK